MVKRLKEVGVGRWEFEQQMDLVGRIRHENIVEMKAYYYFKDEKITVYDYFNRGSVSALLHGIDGQEDMKLIYGIIVAEEKGRIKWEDKVTTYMQLGVVICSVGRAEGTTSAPLQSKMVSDV